MKKTFLFACIFFLVSCASHPIKEPRIDIIKQQLDAIFSKNQFIWNEYNLKKFPVAFVLSKNKSAYLYHGGRMEALAFESLPTHLKSFPISFAVEEVNGRRTLVMLLDNLASRPDEGSTVHFTVHEAFHVFYQDNKSVWKQQDGPQKKGLILPIDPKARYYRWSMGRLISQFLENGDAKNLSKFSSLYNKWEKTYEIESSSDADRAEGSAEYVAIAAGSFVENRNTSVESRYSYLKKVRKEWFEKSNLDFDNEAYLLGTLSGLALDKLNIANWKAQVNAGISPLSILAKTNNPSIHKDDLKEVAEFKRLSVSKMKTVDPNGNLKKFLNNLANNKLNFIAISKKKVNPFTFSMNNAFRTPDPFNKNLYVNVYDISSPVKIVSLTGSRKIIEIDKPLISLSFEATPCDRNLDKVSDVFNVWAIEPTLLKNGKIVSDYIRLYEESRIVSKNGTSWICVD